MEEFDSKKSIIKLIATLRNEYQIADFIEANIPEEILADEEFIAKLIEVNDKVITALEILNGKEINKKIIEEIEQLGLINVIEDEEKLNKIPKTYKKELYEIAQKYEEDEEYEKAKKIYGRIVEYGIAQVKRFYDRNNEKDKIRETIYYKAKFAYYKCKIQNGEILTEEDLLELEKLAKEDKYNILGLTQPGKLTSFEIFESLFEDITIEEIESFILPVITSKTDGIGGEINPPNPVEDKEYESHLVPEERLKHLKTDFEIESCKMGKGKFAGTFIFKVKDSDVVIVEKFFDTVGRGVNKIPVPSYGTATYYVHKDADIDLEKSDRTKLVEKKKEEDRKDEEEKLIDSRRHRGKNYYSDQIKIFKAIEENGRKLAKIESDIKQEQHIDNIEEKEYSENISLQELEEEQIIEEIITRDTIDNKGESQKISKKSDDIEDIIPETEEKIIEEETQYKEEDKSSSYTLEEIIFLIEEFDKEYVEFQTNLSEIEQSIGEISVKIAELQDEISKNINELLTKDNIKQIIQEELEMLEKCKDKKKVLEVLKEKIMAKEKENREERDRLKNELESRIKGED